MIETPKYRVTIRLGRKVKDWDVYVAPIRDSFLLGLDLMLAARVTVSVEGQVHVDGEPIGTVVVGRSVGEYAVSRVLLECPSTLPAEASEKEEPREIDYSTGAENQAGDPDDTGENPYSADARNRAGDPDVTGEDSENPPEKEASTVRRMESAPAVELPEHLPSLYASAGEELDEGQRRALLQLLTKHQEVFAVQHRIDTGVGRPVRQAARRAPLGFRREEERRLCASQLRSRRDYDLRARRRTFHPGDLVFVRDDARKKGRSPKVKPRWRGPALITEKMGNVLYRVQDGRKGRILHHDRLLPYLADKVPLWIQRRRHAPLQVPASGEDPLNALEGDPPARTEEDEVAREQEEDVGGLAEDSPSESDDLDLLLEDLFRDGEDGTSGPFTHAQMSPPPAAISPSGEPTTAEHRGTQTCAPGGQSVALDPEGAEADVAEPGTAACAPGGRSSAPDPEGAEADVAEPLPLPTTRRGRTVRPPAWLRDSVRD